MVSITERGGFEPPDPGLAGQLLSREPDSASLAPLQKKNINGERGIRTPGDLRLNGFQDRLLRPLGHLSISAGINLNQTEKEY